MRTNKDFTWFLGKRFEPTAQQKKEMQIGLLDEKCSSLLPIKCN